MPSSPGRWPRLLREGLLAPEPASPFPQLTRRETEVLSLRARGRSNQQVGHALFLSTKTIRNNVSVEMSKLAATSRAEAIATARDAGLGAP